MTGYENAVTMNAAADPIERALSMRRWAVVGATPDRHKPSATVPQYMASLGYEIVPVNPQYEEVFGRRCYPDLASIEQPVEVVDLFRRSALVGPHVDEAIASGAQVIWMQLGVVDEAAAARARAAGLLVVMDRCPKIELARRSPDPEGRGSPHFPS
jgi:predicted CoA-binding protein